MRGFSFTTHVVERLRIDTHLLALHMLSPTQRTPGIFVSCAIHLVAIQ